MTSIKLTDRITKSNLFDEDGKVFTKKTTDLSNSKFQLIGYNRKLLEENNYTDYGLFRSVIFDLETKNMLCYSPPKSLTVKQFYDNLSDDVLVQEFVEGTMINLFFYNDQWHISTRGNIGGHCKFYQNEEIPTFYEMFENVSRYVKLNYDKLLKNYCYCFVMQNTKNRIVKSILKDNLYFITAYNIDNKENDIFVKQLDSEELNFVKQVIFKDTDIKYPEEYGIISKESFQSEMMDYIDLYASRNTKYNLMGVVFKDKNTGNFIKFRNPNHKEIHDLKGNHCKIQYIYLDLRKQNAVDKYLRYYPEDRSTFTFLRKIVHSYTKKLYENYVECYIQKRKPLKEWPYEFRIHMFNIHQKYLNELKENKKYINMHIVIQYFNDLHPSQQMYALNYNLRQKNIDTMHAELQEKIAV